MLFIVNKKTNYNLLIEKLMYKSLFKYLLITYTGNYVLLSVNNYKKI